MRFETHVEAAQRSVPRKELLTGCRKISPRTGMAVLGGGKSSVL